MAMVAASCFGQYTPPAASQSEVNAGTVGNKYVSPKTLVGGANATRLAPAFTRNSAMVAFNFAINGANSHPITGTNTFRLQHYCSATCYGLRLLYGNSAGQFPGGSTITVEASVEDSRGDIYPVFFNGQRILTLGSGAQMWSDPVPMSVTNGDYIWIRTSAGVTNGGSYFAGPVSNFSGEGHSADPARSLVDGGTIATVANDFLYDAMVIDAQIKGSKSAVAIFGDSISVGLYSHSGDPFIWDAGIVTGFGPNFGANVPYALFGMSSEAFQNFSNPTNDIYRWEMLRGCNIALSAYGANDNPSGIAVMTNAAVSFWMRLRQMGLPVWQMTLLPRTTSTDGFATVQNQTVSAFESDRLAFNALVRSGGYGLLSGYVDAEATAGSNYNGNIVWKPGYTQDGLHPYGTTTNYMVWKCLSSLTNKLVY